MTTVDRKHSLVDGKPSVQSTLHRTQWRILHIMCITHVLANKQFIPHKCGHTPQAVMVALLTTQGTHICLILFLILRGGRVAFIGPNMRRDIVPWSIRWVTDMPPNAKLRENPLLPDMKALAETPNREGWKRPP